MKSRCPTCDRIKRRCLCQFAPNKKIDNLFQVILIQTDSERDHSKNSAIFLYLGLSHLHKKIIKRPSHHVDHPSQDLELIQSIQELRLLEAPILLYPCTDDIQSSSVYDHSSTLDFPLQNTLSTRLRYLDESAPHPHQSKSLPTLIILDMTWGHSQRLIGLSDILKSLPRFTLTYNMITVVKDQRAKYFDRSHTDYKNLRNGKRKREELNSFEATLITLIIWESYPHRSKGSTYCKAFEKYQSLWIAYESWLTETLFRHLPKSQVRSP